MKDFVLTLGYLGCATGATPGYTSRLLLNKVTESYSGAAYSLTYNMGTLPPQTFAQYGSVGVMGELQQKKIEELTLYLIKQQKQIPN